jgi:hypothetical protein
MKLQSSLGIAVVVGLAFGSSVASAEGVREPRIERIQPAPGMMSTTPIEAATPEAIQSHTLFLNRCPGGCTITSGNESAVNNTSSIQGNGVSNYSEFSYGEARWQQVLQCVRETYAPFNVNVVDTRPTSGVYWMTIVAGTSSQFGGLQQGVLGVSPYSFQCPAPLQNNTITFAFVNDPFADNDVNEMCWIIAQETAHSFGLDHEALRNDPMTYIDIGSLPAERHEFKNQVAACGAYQANDDGCACPGSTQNSYARILGIFGPSAPTPPVVEITNPNDGAQVDPGFQVATTVSDSNGITQVELFIDDESIDVLTIAPYIFSTPDNLGDGTHRVTVTATDGQGTPGSATVDVIIGAPCETPGDCAEQGDNLTCVGGRCVPGEGAEGGLGSECTEDAECYSGLCQGSNEGSFCVESCELGSDDCPGGFGCIAGGDGGICWPGAGGGGGCLSADHETPTLPIALGIALGALMIRRRRRTGR